MYAKITNPIAYFWSHVDKSGDCWLWTGSLLNGSRSTNPSGILKAAGKRTLVHCFSYELAYGPVPNGMYVRRTCGVALCVRPEHFLLSAHRRGPIDPIEYFWSRVDKTGDCWLWTGAQNGMGYGNVRIQNQSWLAHRYAYTLTCGPIPEGHFICHHCDTPRCVRPEHLFLGQHIDNQRDMWAKGRGNRTGRCRGEDKPNSHLRNRDVVRIRKLYAAGVMQTELGKLYGVDSTTIHAIVARKNWKHLS